MSLRQSRAPDTQSSGLLWLRVASSVNCGLGPSRVHIRTTTQPYQGAGLLALREELEVSPVLGSGPSPDQSIAAKTGLFWGPSSEAEGRTMGLRGARPVKSCV